MRAAGCTGTLRAIINNTRDLIWSVDIQSHMIAGKRAFSDRVKRADGQNETKVTNADFEQESVKIFFDSYEPAFKCKAFSVAWRRESGGRQIYQDLSFNPIRDIYEDVIGINCFRRDITEPQEYVQGIEKQNKPLREIAWIQSDLVRAPVASILGLAQLCNLDDSPNAKIIPMLKKRQKSSTK